MNMMTDKQINKAINDFVIEGFKNYEILEDIFNTLENQQFQGEVESIRGKLKEKIFESFSKLMVGNKSSRQLEKKLQILDLVPVQDIFLDWFENNLEEITKSEDKSFINFIFGKENFYARFSIRYFNTSNKEIKEINEHPKIFQIGEFLMSHLDEFYPMLFQPENLYDFLYYLLYFKRNNELFTLFEKLLENILNKIFKDYHENKRSIENDYKMKSIWKIFGIFIVKKKDLQNIQDRFLKFFIQIEQYSVVLEDYFTSIIVNLINKFNEDFTKIFDNQVYDQLQFLSQKQSFTSLNHYLKLLKRLMNNLQDDDDIVKTFYNKENIQQNLVKFKEKILSNFQELNSYLQMIENFEFVFEQIQHEFRNNQELPKNIQAIQPLLKFFLQLCFLSIFKTEDQMNQQNIDFDIEQDIQSKIPTTPIFFQQNVTQKNKSPKNIFIILLQKYQRLFKLYQKKIKDENQSRILNKIVNYQAMNYQQNLDELRKIQKNSSFSLTVDHENILESAFNYLKNQSNDNILKSLRIKYEHQQGQDCGGLKNEFFFLVSQQIFNPDNGLFNYIGNGTFLHPTQFSKLHPLENYYLTGKFVAKSILEKQKLTGRFSNILCKFICGQSCFFEDYVLFNQEVYENLLKIKNAENINDWNLFFECDALKNDQRTSIPLIPNGSLIKVTNENKLEYIKLMIIQKVYKEHQNEIEEFLRGFQSLIPQNYMKKFSADDVAFMISGSNEINIDELFSIIQFQEFNDHGNTKNWLKKFLSQGNKEQQKNGNQDLITKFLQFSTGTGKIPFGSIEQYKLFSGNVYIKISKMSSSEQLPCASTCFQNLRIPVYPSYEKFVEKFSAAFEFGLTVFLMLFLCVKNKDLIFIPIDESLSKGPQIIQQQKDSEIQLQKSFSLQKQASFLNSNKINDLIVEIKGQGKIKILLIDQKDEKNVQIELIPNEVNILPIIEQSFDKIEFFNLDDNIIKIYILPQKIPQMEQDMVIQLWLQFTNKYFIQIEEENLQKNKIIQFSIEDMKQKNFQMKILFENKIYRSENLNNKSTFNLSTIESNCVQSDCKLKYQVEVEFQDVIKAQFKKFIYLKNIDLQINKELNFQTILLSKDLLKINFLILKNDSIIIRVNELSLKTKINNQDTNYEFLLKERTQININEIFKKDQKFLLELNNLQNSQIFIDIQYQKTSYQLLRNQIIIGNLKKNMIFYDLNFDHYDQVSAYFFSLKLNSPKNTSKMFLKECIDSNCLISNEDIDNYQKAEYQLLFPYRIFKNSENSENFCQIQQNFICGTNDDLVNNNGNIPVSETCRFQMVIISSQKNKFYQLNYSFKQYQILLEKNYKKKIFLNKEKKIETFYYIQNYEKIFYESVVIFLEIIQGKIQVQIFSKDQQGKKFDEQKYEFESIGKVQQFFFKRKIQNDKNYITIKSLSENTQMSINYKMSKSLENDLLEFSLQNQNLIFFEQNKNEKEFYVQNFLYSSQQDWKERFYELSVQNKDISICIFEQKNYNKLDSKCKEKKQILFLNKNAQNFIISFQTQTPIYKQIKVQIEEIFFNKKQNFYLEKLPQNFQFESKQKKINICHYSDELNSLELKINNQTYEQKNNNFCETFDNKNQQLEFNFKKNNKKLHFLGIFESEQYLLENNFVYYLPTYENLKINFKIEQNTDYILTYENPLQQTVKLSINSIEEHFNDTQIIKKIKKQKVPTNLNLLIEKSNKEQDKQIMIHLFEDEKILECCKVQKFISKQNFFNLKLSKEKNQLLLTSSNGNLISKIYTQENSQKKMLYESDDKFFQNYSIKNQENLILEILGNSLFEFSIMIFPGEQIIQKIFKNEENKIQLNKLEEKYFYFNLVNNSQIFYYSENGDTLLTVYKIKNNIIQNIFEINNTNNTLILNDLTKCGDQKKIFDLNCDVCNYIGKIKSLDVQSKFFIWLKQTKQFLEMLIDKKYSLKLNQNEHQIFEINIHDQKQFIFQMESIFGHAYFKISTDQENYEDFIEVKNLSKVKINYENKENNQNLYLRTFCKNECEFSVQISNQKQKSFQKIPNLIFVESFLLDFSTQIYQQQDKKICIPIIFNESQNNVIFQLTSIQENLNYEFVIIDENQNLRIFLPKIQETSKIGQYTIISLELKYVSKLHLLLTNNQEVKLSTVENKSLVLPSMFNGIIKVQNFNKIKVNFLSKGFLFINTQQQYKIIIENKEVEMFQYNHDQQYIQLYNSQEKKQKNKIISKNKELKMIEINDFFSIQIQFQEKIIDLEMIFQYNNFNQFTLDLIELPKTFHQEKKDEKLIFCFDNIKLNPILIENFNEDINIIINYEFSDDKSVSMVLYSQEINVIKFIKSDKQNICLELKEENQYKKFEIFVNLIFTEKNSQFLQRQIQENLRLKIMEFHGEKISSQLITIFLETFKIIILLVLIFLILYVIRQIYLIFKHNKKKEEFIQSDQNLSTITDTSEKIEFYQQKFPENQKEQNLEMKQEFPKKQTSEDFEIIEDFKEDISI